MAEDTELLVVPHTHWDREWYQTFQQFRMRLVRAVDKVIDVLERDPAFSFFMLDGQMVVLEDYLDVRPERAGTLRELAQSGRLLVGPWYVQPDEFLVGGEALIRNLQLGTRLAQPYGGAMPIGYVPDTFGHIAQLPQILRGFGLDNAVLWRGVPPGITRNEFQWSAPDGSQVLVLWLSHESGYSNAAMLPVERDALEARVTLVTSALRPRSTTGALLLMNGSDHLEPQPELPQLVRTLNEVLAPQHMHATIGTLPQYVDIARERSRGLDVHQGELRSSYRAHLLPGVYSTRMWLKQRNAAVEAALVRWAEPMTTWAWALGADHPTRLLEIAWRHLLHNHPHDSICGCGIDQVHAEMLPRFDQSQQIADELTAQAMTYLASRVNTLPGDASADAIQGTPIVVFNPGPGPRTDLVACDVELPSHNVEIVSPGGAPIPCTVNTTQREELLRQDVDKAMVVGMLSMATDGRALGYTLTDVRVSEGPEPSMATIEVTASQIAAPDAAVVERAKAAVSAMAARDDITTFRAIAYASPHAQVTMLARDVPAHGGQTVFLRAATAASSTEARNKDLPAVHAGPTTLENEYLAVRVDPASGTFTLLDKLCNVSYTDQNRIEDSGDVGDLYTYCPPASDWVVRAPAHQAHVEVLSRGPLAATLRVKRLYRLPISCSPDRASRAGETADCTVTSDITLVAGARRVEVRTTIDNAARDHRLRVLFPVPFLADTADAEGTFEVASRPATQPIPPVDERGQWAELPVNTQPHKRFVSLGTGTHGLAVLNRGLPEYEVVTQDAGGTDHSAVALTLLRSVEWLSRGDLATRRGHAGPALHTPQAQGIGEHIFEYALVPFSGMWFADEASVIGEAHAFEARLRACVTTPHDGPLPASWSFARLSPSHVVLSAIKRAERGEGVIVRVYNPTARPTAAEIAFALPVREIAAVTLNEEDIPGDPASDFAISGSQVRFDIAGGQILTLRVRMDESTTVVVR